MTSARLSKYESDLSVKKCDFGVASIRDTAAFMIKTVEKIRNIVGRKKNKQQKTKNT